MLFSKKNSTEDLSAYYFKEPLTEPLRIVLYYAVTTADRQETAQLTGLNLQTVSNYLGNIFQYFGVKDFLKLLKYFFDNPAVYERFITLNNSRHQKLFDAKTLKCMKEENDMAVKNAVKRANQLKRNLGF